MDRVPGSLRRLCLVALPALSTVASFGTINAPVGLGQHNEHEMVTRLAFQCPEDQKSDGVCFEPHSLNQLAGTHFDFLGLPIPGGGFNGAVGAPDMLDPMPEGPEAHCDDADYIGISSYPRTREQATAALQACVDHLRARYSQAWGAAARLLDEEGRIRLNMVELTIQFGGDCTFAFPSLLPHQFGRAKCSVIEGFGRALHGVQDFYAHSNWADRTDGTRPISDINPPGLNRNDTAPFITDLSATGKIPADQIPINMTTGCFVLSDSTPGTDECAGRVTHHTLSKDHGIINLDGTFGDAGPDTPRAELVPGNFERAVHAAVQGSREVWANLRTELRKQYGTAKGDLMICSLVRDDPVHDCRNRTISYVLDRSARSSYTLAAEVERLVAEAVNSQLAANGMDKVSVIQFDDTAEVVSPWGDPSSAALDALETTEGKSNIGGGLALAIDEIIASHPDTHVDRGAVLLLTAGSESEEWLGKTFTEVRRAMDEGIRVHYGCVNPLPLAKEHDVDSAGWSECSPGQGVVAAVLKSGGAFAFISSRATQTAESFANLAITRGLTASDETGEESTAIFPGMAIAELLSPEFGTKYFTYTANAGERLNFTIRDRARDGQGTGGCFSVTLMDTVHQLGIAGFTSCDGGPSYLAYDATLAIELVLVAEYGGGNSTFTRQEPDGEIIFTIEILTSMPEKVEAAEPLTGVAGLSGTECGVSCSATSGISTLASSSQDELTTEPPAEVGEL